MTEHATADTTPAGGTTPAATDLELTIGGMTCASCAARIEKKLNKVDGRHRQRQLRHREGQGQLHRRHRP